MMHIEVTLKQAELHRCLFWRDDFIGCKTLRKVRLMFLQVELKEAQFNLINLIFKLRKTSEEQHEAKNGGCS